jgi:hypothetical protein
VKEGGEGRKGEGKEGGEGRKEGRKMKEGGEGRKEGRRDGRW